MRLFEIRKLHMAPKSGYEGIDYYALAEDSGIVVDNLFSDRIEDVVEELEDLPKPGEEGYDEFDGPYWEGKSEGKSYRDYLIEVGGLTGDESYVDSVWEDGYYGPSVEGFKDLGEISKEDADVLIRLAIVKQVWI